MAGWSLDIHAAELMTLKLVLHNAYYHTQDSIINLSSLKSLIFFAICLLLAVIGSNYFTSGPHLSGFSWKKLY